MNQTRYLLPMPREAAHPDSLLCERCGYRLDDLDPALPCPECGRPIADSLPHRRAGSAWQRRPGFRAWLSTNWATLRHPWTRWDEVRVAPATGLLAANALLIGVALAAMLLLEGTGEVFGGPRTVVLFAPFVIFSLSKVEALGLRVLGARHGWRVTKPVAAAVVAHASIGWLLALPALGAEILYFRSLDPRAQFAWSAAPPWVAILVLAAAPLAGMLGFETLAWLGWRRMKFANRDARQPKD